MNSLQKKKQLLTEVKKIIRIRKYLIDKGKSKTNILLSCKIIEKLSIWLQTYNNCNYEQLKKFCIRYYDDIIFLIPSNESKKTLIKNLNQYIYESRTSPASFSR